MSSAAAHSNRSLQLAGELASLLGLEPVDCTLPGRRKSRLARRIYELKKLRHQVAGPFVEVNCATLKGDSTMSALFGHHRDAFTGAVADQQGLLRSADTGMLFLDEIGELGLDEQAMILRAIEDKRFLPVGDAAPRTMPNGSANISRGLGWIGPP